MSMNFVTNFCLRHTIKLDTDWILNMTRHSFTMPVDDMLNNFINLAKHGSSESHTSEKHHHLNLHAELFNLEVALAL